MSLLVFYSHYDSLLHLTEYRHKDSVPKLAVVTVSLLVMFLGVDMNHPEMQIITREFLFRIIINELLTAAGNMIIIITIIIIIIIIIISESIFIIIINELLTAAGNMR